LSIEAAVVVTGSAGGIGRALCQVFQQEPCYVIGIDKGPSVNAQTNLTVDLARICTDHSYLSDSANSIRKALGNRPLRALINNAAVQIVKPLEKLDATDWQQTLNVNLVAPFLLGQALLEQLKTARGSIVNIASIHAVLTKPSFVAYATSKAALVGLTKSLAVEMGDRVRVNAIVPAAVDTEMLRTGLGHRSDLLDELSKTHPIGRIGQPEEIAQLARFLVFQSSRFMTGAILHLDGGIGARLHDPC
jgi:NAD(P)-dependent dehydrogenase (short-subunit alcohol dehydrogenase family)